jgi:hypothetical protein
VSARGKLASDLRLLRACPEAIEYAEQFVDDWPRAWAECDRGDWMLWLAARAGVKRKTVVFAACQVARTALGFVTAGDDRPLRAIEAAEAWCQGATTLGRVRAADAAASYAAASASASAFFVVAAASYAAAAASASAAAAFFVAAAEAAASAASAAFAAADADADAEAARTAALKAGANIVRQHIPWALVSDAMDKAGGRQ